MNVIEKVGDFDQNPKKTKTEGQKLTDKTLLEVFPGGTVDKNPPAGHTDLIPGPGRFTFPEATKPMHLECANHSKRSHHKEKLLNHIEEQPPPAAT